MHGVEKSIENKIPTKSPSGIFSKLEKAGEELNKIPGKGLIEDAGKLVAENPEILLA